MANYISRCSFELKQIILLIKIKNQQADETRSCFFTGHVVSIPRLQGDKRGTEPETFYAIVHVSVMSIWTYTQLFCLPSKQKWLNIWLLSGNKLQSKDDGQLLNCGQFH